MSKEATGAFPAKISAPRELEGTIVRISPTDLSLVLTESLSANDTIKLSVVLGEDRFQTELEGTVTNFTADGDETMYEVKLENVTSESRIRLVSFLDDVIREEYLKEYPAGTEVFKEGDDSRDIYYIAFGRFVIDKDGEKIAEITHEDQFMGEISFLLGNPRSASVTALEDSLLMEIPEDTFHKTIASNPKFAVALAKLLAKRLTDTSKELAASRSVT